MNRRARACAELLARRGPVDVSNVGGQMQELIIKAIVLAFVGFCCWKVLREESRG